MMKNADYRFIYHEDSDCAMVGAFGVSIKDNQDVVVGTISGFTYSDCIHIDVLFVNEELQGLGFGKKLLEKAENIGLERGCTHVTVHTMDFEAPDFYQRLGFEVEFIREGSETGSKLYILHKKII